MLARLLLVVATVVFVALAATPAVVAVGIGWLTFGDPSAAPGSAAAQQSSLEAWTFFALFYLAWMFGLVLLLIVVNDRLGLHWRSWDRRRRPAKRRRRRLAAGLDLLARQEEARAEAAARPPRQIRARPAPPPKAGASRDGSAR